MEKVPMLPVSKADGESGVQAVSRHGSGGAAQMVLCELGEGGGVVANVRVLPMRDDAGSIAAATLVAERQVERHAYERCSGSCPVCMAVWKSPQFVIHQPFQIYTYPLKH